MNFELKKPAEASRFVLALMLSSATALLVAAPLLVAMVRSDSTVPANPPRQTILEEDDQPPPLLGSDESEVGRIDEADNGGASAFTPAGPASGPVTEPDEEQGLQVAPPSTTIAPTTTAVPPTSTTLRPPRPLPFEPNNEK